MSQCTKCDVCGRTTPEVAINRAKRKEGWFINWFDAYSGRHYQKIDICDYCWNGYKSFVENQLAGKELIPGEK